MSAGSAWPAIAVALPLLLALALSARRARSLVPRLAPLAALPALALVLLDQREGFELRWALLGFRLGMADDLARAFLAFTALLWLCSAWFADAYLGAHPRRASFFGFFLVTMAGNLGVVLARDELSFYLCYAAMSLASYGLVLHERTPAARRAGLVYIMMALFGDVLLLAALLATSSGAQNLALAEVPRVLAESPHAHWIALLAFMGFGVKAGGLLPLHLWLPLAHPVAPAPASALLSGAMIKAGLLGWLRFLPLGTLQLPEAGRWCALAGIVAAFYAAAVGTTQRDPKTVLAYSSISQMGLMMVVLGCGIAAPSSAAAATAALVVFATHHAVAKASLFLGTAVLSGAGGRRARTLAAIGLALPAFAIAGGPLSSGALAKAAAKDVLAAVPSIAPLASLFALAAIGSTLLMARFLALALGGGGHGPGAARGAGLWAPWAALLGAGAFLCYREAPIARSASPSALLTAGWPLAAGCVLAWLLLRAERAGRFALPAIPAGDLLTIFERIARFLGRCCASIAASASRVASSARAGSLAFPLARVEALERRLGEDASLGLLLAFLLVALFYLAAG